MRGYIAARLRALALRDVAEAMTTMDGETQLRRCIRANLLFHAAQWLDPLPPVDAWGPL
jgi:hypothetical protein